MTSPSKTRAMTLAALVFLAACGSEAAQKVSLPPPSAIPPAASLTRVNTIVASATDVAAAVHGTGTSQPIRQADLALAMSGRIGSIHVREGQQVRAGQLLVALDGRMAELSAEQARSAAAASDAQAAQLEADYKRLEPLAQRRTIPMSRLEQLESQGKAARAQAHAAESAAHAASQAAANAILRAPFAGTIVDLPHEVGEMASGTPLARLVDLSRLEIHVRVAARDLGRLSVGDPVVARFPQIGVKSRGSISNIGYEIDPATSTAEVVAVIANEGGKLRGGLFTELEVAPSTKRKAVVVPKGAVMGAGTGANVFVVANGRVVRRVVEIAPFDETNVEILRGIADQTVIVVSELDRLSEGLPVSSSPHDSSGTKVAEVLR